MATGEGLSSTDTSINASVRSGDELEKDWCCSWPICNPRKAIHRYFVLIFMCLIGFGSYFCYDSPGALQDQVTRDMRVTTSDFSNLYAWYSWPNVILCFFGGFLIDRVFGIRWGAVIFGFFVLGGQVIFALGAQVNKFWVMELGRFVFGIGGESLAVAQNTYAVSWFKGKELNMVFGLQLSIARVLVLAELLTASGVCLGSTVNFALTPLIYKSLSSTLIGHYCLAATLFIATFTCVFSQLCSFILGFFDWRAEKILNKAASQTGSVIRLRDVKDFPLTFWLITLICVAYYVAIFPFVGLGKVFFSRKYDMTDTTGVNSGATVDSVVYVISAVASPVFGIIVDKTGRNLWWVLSAIVLTLGCHLLLCFTFLTPWIPMVFIGLGYSLLACGLWPMVALEVPEHQLGTAYGIMQSVQNLGLAVVAMAAGAIVDDKGYLFLEIFFIDWLCLAVIATVILFFVNRSKGGLLNMSVAQRRRKEEELSAADLLESERLLASGAMADVTPNDLLQPRSEFYIRNRYLSRIGAKLPPHYDITTCALIHRTGLK